MIISVVCYPQSHFHLKRIFWKETIFETLVLRNINEKLRFVENKSFRRRR